MDEDLLTIRRTLHSGPPSVEARNRARDLLTAEIAAAASDPRPHRAGLRASPGKSWWGRGAVLSGGLAALIVAGLVAVPALDNPDHDAPGGSRPGAEAGPPGPAADPANARQLLLAAAGRAATAPATTGKYWHVRRVAVAGPIKVGSYDLVGQWLNETWTARDAGGPNWTGDLSLGYKPRTKDDEAAWKAAGSPTTWTIPGDTASGTVTYSSAPGRPTLSRLERSTRTPFLGDLGGMGLEQLEDLPTDPKALRAAILAAIPDADPANVDGLLFSVLGMLLLDTPAPPAVRAAAFTLLAEIPGVKSVGDVTDTNGRTGTGVELIRQHKDNITSRHLLVIDPKTYLILAREATGMQGTNSRPLKASNTVMLVAEWTDTEPSLPKVP